MCNALPAKLETRKPSSWPTKGDSSTCMCKVHAPWSWPTLSEAQHIKRPGKRDLPMQMLLIYTREYKGLYISFGREGDIFPSQNVKKIPFSQARPCLWDVLLVSGMPCAEGRMSSWYFRFVEFGDPPSLLFQGKTINSAASLSLSFPLITLWWEVRDCILTRFLWNHFPFYDSHFWAGFLCVLFLMILELMVDFQWVVSWFGHTFVGSITAIRLSGWPFRKDPAGVHLQATL